MDGKSEPIAKGLDVIQCTCRWIADCLLLFASMPWNHKFSYLLTIYSINSCDITRFWFNKWLVLVRKLHLSLQSLQSVQSVVCVVNVISDAISQSLYLFHYFPLDMKMFSHRFALIMLYCTQLNIIDRNGNNWLKTDKTNKTTIVRYNRFALLYYYINITIFNNNICILLVCDAIRCHSMPLAHH